MRLVRQTPAAQKELGEFPAFEVRVKTTEEAYYIVELSPPEPEPLTSYTTFRVHRETGALEVSSLCEAGGYVSLARKQFEAQAFDKLFSLPEFKGFARQTLELSAGKARMVTRLESCTEDDPTGGTPDQASFYVGELHEDHSVRIFTVQVTNPGLQVAVADLGSDTFVPYAQWRKTQPAKDLVWYGLPTDRGTGPLGYGPPNRTVQASAFNHPTKRAVMGLMMLDRVEYYTTKYPAFVGSRTNASPIGRAELDGVKKANALWPFEIVWDSGKKRIRWDGTEYLEFDGSGWHRMP